ncbi:MAG: hypothetical protein WBE37_24795 [Bryobacteraceae bacterium]
MGTLRPSVSGPVDVGFSPSTDGKETRVTHIQNPGVFYCGVPGNQSCTGANGMQFGNLGRNAIIGPGFAKRRSGVGEEHENYRKNHLANSRRRVRSAEPLEFFTNWSERRRHAWGRDFCVAFTRFPPGDSGAALPFRDITPVIPVAPP